MNDYISRKALLKFVGTKPHCPTTSREDRLINAFISTIKEFPASGVCCEDCEYRTKAEWSDRVYYCDYCGRDEVVSKNDYCSKGKRKEAQV